MVMSDADGVEWTRATFPRFVDPSLVRKLKREGGAVGHVTQGPPEGSRGSSVLVEGKALNITDPEGFQPGEKVRAEYKRREGGIYIAPYSDWCEEQDRKTEKQREHRHIREKARSRYEWWRRTKATEFWNQYQIPFQYDVAIKGRLSGLARGSSGDARAANTVEHLYVREGFTEGRLRRDADTFLCSPGAEWPFEDVQREDPAGYEYLPPVSCSQCLGLMERWKSGGGDD